MRLSRLLQLPDFKKIPIVIIGRLKTDDSLYAILGRKGQKVLPMEGNTHLIEITSAHADPEISRAEELSIRRRLRLPVPPLASLSSKPHK